LVDVQVGMNCTKFTSTSCRMSWLKGASFGISNESDPDDLKNASQIREDH